MSAAEKPSFAYKWALACSLLALVFSIIAIATPEWTVDGNKTIGLWVISDNGEQYTWTNQGEYFEPFFYTDFMQACRGLMMSGVMVAGLGCLYHIFVLFKNKINMTSGNILLTYYLLASFLLLITAAVYSSMIPQPVCIDGSTTCTELNEIEKYMYRGGYGYSLWFCWISGGLFMLPAALTYEGGKQRRKEKMRDEARQQHSTEAM
ncbi:uncharacterized protein LOC120338825 [Styela clava]|uniref:uncharacterized protein LOC120338825 n=1 Tax=Styela clava TaxID=7725 RepID=UPI001939EEE2|nr:uncharacterized protein LOC120338825 [Styela clava]